MKLKIINNSGLGSNFEEMLRNLTLFAKDTLSIEKLPSVHLNSDVENAKDTLGRTGYYNPEVGEIHVYVDGRHDKDILRSVAHELVHHRQNEQGSLSHDGYSGDGYAQKNPHLRNMEKEAYLKGNMCFRDWEDSYKATNYSERGTNMSLKEWKNSEMNRLMMKKFGLLKEEIEINEVDADEDGAPAAPEWSDKDADNPEEPPKWADEDDNDPEVGDSLEEIIFQEVMKMLGGE